MQGIVLGICLLFFPHFFFSFEDLEDSISGEMFMRVLCSVYLSCKPEEHLWSHGSVSERAINDLNLWITAR